jgi:hypothetical protein
MSAVRQLSIRDRVAAHRLAHPEHSMREAGAALGLTKRQVKDAWRGLPSPAPRPRPSGTRPRLPTFMVRGEGYRRHDCARYVDCLTGAAFTISGDVRCPRVCERFAERDHEADRAVAMAVPRESWGGEAW